MSSPIELPDHLSEVLEQGRSLSEQGYRGRFAPTPSGPLHLGNLRTALLSWLCARLENGQWLLRIDDLDTPRVRSGAIASIQRDLRWLGLSWDGQAVFQSGRRGLYASFLSALRRQGLIYACRCSRRQLSGSVIYPGTCRLVNQGWGLKRGRLPSWRLRVSEPYASTVGDVVLRRADGVIAYHLATAIDELVFGINEVVRGQDLAEVFAAQSSVIHCFGMPTPRYRYVPLLCDASGRKLSKRNHVQGVGPLRDRGTPPASVLGRLASDLDLVPSNSALSSQELLEELRTRQYKIKRLLVTTDSSGNVRDHIQEKAANF